MKDSNGVILYLAFLDVSIEKGVMSRIGFGGDIPRGIVEVYIWKSLKEAIPLAEKAVIHN